jgi:hypothetical protein
MMKKDTDHIKVVTNSGPVSALPVLLRQIKDSSISILLSHLENLFGSCDDLFFDLSSRAASNSEQNLYFESMREVRLKKHGVITVFKAELESGFHHLANNSKPSAVSSDINTYADINHSNLSLVQNDVLEQDVAITSMVSKAQVNCQESLYHLNLRFDYLISDTKVNEQNNPMDPQQICLYFADACKDLDLNIKARIILFKQFDRLLVSKLAALYSSANNLLIEADVLPNTRSYAKTASAAKSNLTDNRHSPQAQQSVELELAELSSMMLKIRQQNPGMIAELIPNYTAYSTNPGPALPNHELLQTLTAIHHSMPAPASDQDLQLEQNLRDIIHEILNNKETNQLRALNQPDDDVINLVAMFFDFVLDDKNLPVAVQALISRLQIPVLKIALHDKTFFSNGSHPARKLINAIAEASIGWDESTQPQRDRLYSLTTQITQDINDGFEDNSQIFADKLEELNTFIQKTDHKSALIEKRTGQAAQGEARTKLAKLTAQKVLFEKLEASILPESINEFLTGHWLSLLVMTHLRFSDESPEWIDCIQLIDDLIWASQRCSDTKSQSRYEKIKPDLLSRIAEGMNQVATTNESAKEITQGIEHTLDQLYSADNNTLLLSPLSSEQAKLLGHAPGDTSKNWKDMSGVERQQARHKELTYEYIRKVEQLPLQTWLSYSDDKAGKVIRCKLASRIESSDTYVFVNRFGFKTLEKQRKDFACDIQASRATILDKSNLFDRAMDNVLTSLKGTASTQASPSL